MTGAADRLTRRLAGLFAFLALTIFAGGAFVFLLLFSGKAPAPFALFADPYLRRVVLFTLEQAALSSLMAVAGALPLALALHRARFPGREAVLRLFLLPQALPVLVGALALLAVWGRNGYVSEILLAAGGPRLDVYGLPGILIAHVFFNLPLATRLMLARLDAVPAESWKLAGALSFPAAATFRIVEWPAIRNALPGAASLVFMLCVTSFTLVLVLGGGPGATTLEVAIYQSLRYDFDPGRAVVLALVQVVLTAAFVAATAGFRNPLAAAFTLARPAVRYDLRSPFLRLAVGLTVALGLAFILSPFVAVVVDGLRADLLRLAVDPMVWRAAATSAWIALGAASLALLLSACLLVAAQSLAGQPGTRKAGNALWQAPARLVLELSGSLVLVVPPIVVGAGWFLALREVTDVFAAAPYVVVAGNAVMAVPFVVRIVGPALAASSARHDRLAESLGIFGLARLRLVEWPALKRPLGLGFAFALALSLGDLGTIALFGSQDLITLPYLLLQRMGSYRTDDAAGIALFLGALCLALMALAERGLSAGETSR